MKKTIVIKSLLDNKQITAKASGKKYNVVTLELDAPFATQSGNVGHDKIVADLVSEQEINMGSLMDMIQNGCECEATLAFSLHEFNGKKYQSCRISNIQTKMV